MKLPEGRARWIGRGLALLAGLGLGGVLVSGLGRGPRAVISGPLTPEVSGVDLSDPTLDHVVAGELHGARYTLAVPRAAKDPVVVVRGPGEALVRSRPLGDVSGEVSLPLLAPWAAALRIRRLGERVRFDWSPIPVGPGFPVSRRYSILVSYAKADGDLGQSSLVAFDPAAELSLEDLRGYLPDLPPGSDEVELELRAYDPSETDGALWVGARARWRLGEPLQLEPPPR